MTLHPNIHFKGREKHWMGKVEKKKKKLAQKDQNK
jgi:hypothetical protein